MLAILMGGSETGRQSRNFIVYPSITSGVSTMYRAITAHIVFGRVWYL